MRMALVLTATMATASATIGGTSSSTRSTTWNIDTRWVVPATGLTFGSRRRSTDRHGSGGWRHRRTVVVGRNGEPRPYRVVHVRTASLLTACRSTDRG